MKRVLKAQRKANGVAGGRKRGEESVAGVFEEFGGLRSGDQLPEQPIVPRKGLGISAGSEAGLEIG